MRPSTGTLVVPLASRRIRKKLDPSTQVQVYVSRHVALSNARRHYRDPAYTASGPTDNKPVGHFHSRPQAAIEPQMASAST